MDTTLENIRATYRNACDAYAAASLRAEIEAMDDASPSARLRRLWAYVQPAERAARAAEAELRAANG